MAEAAEGGGGCLKRREAVAEAAQGGAARLSGSEEGEGKRSDWDGEAKDGGGRRSKAKLPTADRSRASPGAESRRSPTSCSDPRPTKPEAAEAAPTGAESCLRSPKQPKPRRLERKAAAGAPTKTAKGACPHAASPCRLPRLLTSAPCRLPRLLTSAARQTPMHTGSPHVRPTARPPQSLRRGFAAAPLRGGRLTPHKS